MAVVLPASIRAQIERIRLNNTGGATSLATQAAGVLIMAVRAHDLRCLEEAARHLVAAQGSMAPILNLANLALWAAEGENWPPSVEASCAAFVARLETAGDCISRNASELIADGAVVLTHSYSQTVRDALGFAAAAGHKFRVVCTESRPVQEGIAMARDLGAAGLPVTLIVDAAVHARMPGVSIVFVGADSVSSSGVVNKIGTSIVALAARARAVPVYVLCGTGKFLTPGYSPPPEPPRPAQEITQLDSSNVAIENFYFEWTPLELVTGIVTEEGLLSPEQVGAQQPVRLHPALMRRRRRLG